MRIDADDTRLRYVGRIDFDNRKAPVFAYSGSSVSCRFKGCAVSAYIGNTDGDWKSFLGYFIDGKQYTIELLRDGSTHLLKLGEGLTDGWHDLMIFKRQNQCHYITFGGLELEDNAVLGERPPEKSRRIEVIGDSISCGEVVEATAYAGQEDPECMGEYTNAWYSYGWQLARMLDADIHITSESGIALLENTGYFNETDGNGRDAQGMENCYDKIQFNRLHGETKPWDFSRYTPQLVIVALGQNDAHPDDYMASDYDGMKAMLWRGAYQKFIVRIMGLYPDAHIILTTTILRHDLSWDRAIRDVCDTIASDRVHHFLYSRTGCATPGHVRINEAQEMAEELHAYITRLGDIWQ